MIPKTLIKQMLCYYNIFTDGCACTTNNNKISNNVKVMIMSYYGPECVPVTSLTSGWHWLKVFITLHVLYWCFVYSSPQEQAVCIHFVMNRIKWIVIVTRECECEYPCNSELYCDSLFFLNSWCMLFWLCIVCFCVCLCVYSRSCSWRRVRRAKETSLPRLWMTLWMNI